MSSSYKLLEKITLSIAFVIGNVMTHPQRYSESLGKRPAVVYLLLGDDINNGEYYLGDYRLCKLCKVEH